MLYSITFRHPVINDDWEYPPPISGMLPVRIVDRVGGDIFPLALVDMKKYLEQQSEEDIEGNDVIETVAPCIPYFPLSYCCCVWTWL